jgi:hypothetical protein
MLTDRRRRAMTAIWGNVRKLAGGGVFIAYDSAEPLRGVFYWLGQGYGQGTWHNPRQAGMVGSGNGNPLSAFLDPTNLFNNDDTMTKQFIPVTPVKPVGFVLQDHGGTTGGATGNVQIQGTNDFSTWTTLMTVTPPGTSSNASIYYEPSSAILEFYQGCRLVMDTGARLGHFDVFGTAQLLPWDYPPVKGFTGSYVLPGPDFRTDNACTVSGGGGSLHIDGSLGDTSAAGTATFDFGSAIFIPGGFSVFAAASSSRANFLKVEVSVNNTDWTTVVDAYGMPNGSQGWEYMPAVSPPTTGQRYVRVTPQNGGRWEEIRFWGSEDS